MPGFHPDCNSGGEPSRKVWAKKKSNQFGYSQKQKEQP